MAISTPATEALPRSYPVRSISIGDLNAALREGYDDFKDKRGDLIILGAIYPAVGFFAAVAAQGGALLPLMFPMMAALSLLGPLASTGFYVLAKRREAGLESSWWHFLDVRKSASRDEIAIVAVVLIALAGAWLFAAWALHALFFGIEAPTSIRAFAATLLTTPQGWAMIILGNLIGAAFAVVVLAISFVSLPMLIDRNVSAGDAMRTSIAAFNANRAVTLGWGLRVGVLLVLGAIPLFFGLAVVLPVLGYATWHLYTKVVDRSALPPA
jgi:uncharacterized membrane protein